ncbi:MAG: glycosyltransferase family 2 protein [bacterium]|nr:glycosyltransferase family 2 protein [bacterium]
MTTSETTVSIIIPAYNEAGNIEKIVAGIKALYPAYEIIVINDGSTDNTAGEAQRAGAKVFSHPYNIGNGAAIKSGIRVATGDIMVFMDGDGQHDPKNIAELLKFFPEYDMAVGARSTAGQASFGRALSNRVFNWFASYVAKFPIKDLTSGFRAVKSNVVRNYLYLLPNTYSYPTTLTLGVLRSGMSVKYVSITTRKRKTGKSHVKPTDAVRFFMIITRICTLFSPMRIFLPVSFAMFLVGIFNYIYTYIMQSRFTNMSVFMFVASIMIFMMSLISEQICQMRFERRGSDRSLLKSSPTQSDERQK